MSRRQINRRFPCTFIKACHIHWLYFVIGLSQTEVALKTSLNVGTVNHVIHRRRFSSAYPVEPMNGN